MKLEYFSSYYSLFVICIPILRISLSCKSINPDFLQI